MERGLVPVEACREEHTEEAWHGPTAATHLQQLWRRLEGWDGNRLRCKRRLRVLKGVGGTQRLQCEWRLEADGFVPGGPVVGKTLVAVRRQVGGV